jgi:hypothetical protein
MSSSDIKETAQQVVEGPKQFFKDGFQFINRCKKPDQQGMGLVQYKGNKANNKVYH